MKSEFQWWRARFLHERVQLYGDAGVPVSQAAVRQWQSDAWLDDATFRRRLAKSGWTADRLGRALLDENPPPSTESTPSWVGTLLESFLTPARSAGTRTGDVHTGTSALGRFTDGCVTRAISHIRHRYPAIADSALEDLTSDIRGQLLTLALRAVILEMHAAHALAPLPGSSPEARAQSYATRYLSDPTYCRQILDKYPVLGRLLVDVTDHWIEAIDELLSRFEDSRALGTRWAELGISQIDVARIVGVSPRLSDAHRRGRGVYILQLDTGARVVYKPKPLATHAEFARLCDWASDRGVSPSLRHAAVIDCGTYGWMEFIAVEPLTEDAVPRFARRIGILLGTLYILRGVDVHYENIIAKGEHPIAIDLEALFHHRHVHLAGDDAASRALGFLDTSVLSTGLLPASTWSADQVADISGLGGAGGRYGRRIPLIVEDSECFRIQYGQPELPAGRNRPRTEAGGLSELWRYVDDISGGFEAFYRCCLDHKSELRTRLTRFADVTVRFVPRATSRYALFLKESLHPKYLGSGIERDRVFEKLWYEAMARPMLGSCVPSEQSDLLRGDIPIFTTTPSSTSLYDSECRELLDMFASPALSIVQHVIEDLSPADLDRQDDLLRTSIVATSGAPRVLPADTCGDNGPEASDDSFLAGATSIADLLANRAIRGGDDVAWVGLSLRGMTHWHWAMAPLALSVYEGIGGITLFMAYLAAETGRETYYDLARRGRRTLLTAARDRDPLSLDLGAFTGWASLLYVLRHLHALWPDDETQAAQTRCLEHIARWTGIDRRIDVLGGSAGAALVLLDAAVDLGPRAGEVADACGRRLLEAQLDEPSGAAWISTAADYPIGGMSHGASGIIWALARLTAATGDRRYVDAARRALPFDRAQYSYASGDWIHTSPQKGELEGHMHAWCHGPAGIALARAQTRRHMDDEQMLEDIEQGVAATMKQGFGQNDCLCHGDIGNALILDHIGTALGRSDWLGHARGRAARASVRGVRQGWRSGLPGQAKGPTFMTGVSGIGMGLLRFAFPDRVPSVLWLEGPRRP